MVSMLFDIMINKRFIDMNDNRAPRDKLLEFCFPRFINFVQHGLQNAVSRRIHPIRTRLALLQEIIIDRPRIINFHALEIITVIPSGKLFHLVLISKIACHLCDVFPRVTTGICIAAGNDGRNSQVIQSAENAFLRNPQNSRENRKIKRRIRLQRRRKQIAEEANGLFVIPMQPCALDGGIIFVNQQDRLRTIMRFQNLAKQLE